MSTNAIRYDDGEKVAESTLEGGRTKALVMAVKVELVML